MGFRRGGWALVEFFLAWMLLLGAWVVLEDRLLPAQTVPAVATTLVQDTVYRGDGTAAGGTVLVSWPAFSTATGANVPAGSTSVTIGAGGALSVNLVPNAGSNPMGSYYTAVYHLNDGTVTREYWVVPVNAAAVQVGAIRSTVLPTSVAMQTVSKAYVDQAIAQATGGSPLAAGSPYVMVTGDTMTGPLVLPGDPTAPLQASDKQYVDEQIAGVSGGGGQKVSLLPQATQTVVQPAGTQLGVNILNGVEDATQYVTGAGNNGIATATASTDCANGCQVKVDQNDPSTEVVAPTAWNNKTHVVDERGGATVESFTNPLAPQANGVNVAKTIDVTSTQSAQAVHAATGSGNIFSSGLTINDHALAGGSNLFPAEIQGTVPYFKSTYNALTLNGTNNTLGQHVLFSSTQSCYGVGDCLIGGQFLLASGGFRDDADEGAHPFDRSFGEDTRVFTGTCGTGCTTGSTVVQVTGAANAGTQGEGRYLLDTNASKVLRTGALVGGVTSGRQPTATFSGTNFALSTFLETAQSVPTQANAINPGVVTVAIATSGVPTGFATNTAALAQSSGVACVSDIVTGTGLPLNFETAAYSTVDGSHLRMTLNKPHAIGATVAVGGLCGYGLEQTVDTVNGIRQVFPVIGSNSATSLLYATGVSSVAGLNGGTSAFANVNLVVAAIARTNNVVTVTTAANLPEDLNGLTMTVQGVTDSSYNGSFAVTTTGPNSLTYAETGANSTTSGGTVSLLTGGYALYPMAEVLGVYNAGTKAVDGQITLAANTVPWAANDPVEEPHYFQEAVRADTDVITQFTPRPSITQDAGVQYMGNNGPGLIGFRVENGVAASSYFGNGGTHTAPSVGFAVQGIWRHSMEMQAGEDAAMEVHCNSHGCDKWNSAYDLFQLDTSVGVDRMNYSPATSTLNLSLRGTSYGFNPLGMTAGTINVGTLNAGTINGHVTGSVAAASLPVFGASGVAHVQGAVPDPGATAGAVRFLREDGSWTVNGTVASASGFSTTGPLNFPQRGKLLGEYLLAEGTGTVAHDTSGQGNDGTINGATWEGTADLSFGAFGEYIALPAGVNTAQTFQFAIYQAPFGPATTPLAPGYGDADNFPGNPSLLSHTGDGVTFIQNSLQAVKASRYWAFNTDGSEAGEAVPAGWHVVTLVCGVSGSPAHYLYDGQEVASYVKQNTATCPNPTTGNFQIGGSSKYTSTWFLGKVAAAWAWSAPLSVSDAALAAQSALAYMRTKGVPMGYRSLRPQTPVLLAGMDSRTAGVGITAATAWPATMTLTDTTYARVNLGSPGATVFDVCNQFPLLYGQQAGPGSGPAITVIWGGVNDILFTNETPRQIANGLRCIVQGAKAIGSRVVLATEISAIGLGDAGKDALDPILRAEAFGWGVDNLADLASDPILGADGASGNLNYFPDSVHPDAAAELHVTAIMQNAVNELLGSSETSRHQTAAANYAETAGDRFLDLTGTVAQTVTLPSCTGYSLGRQVLNLGTNAATVSAASGQTLLGATAIAPGTRAAFVPIPGAMATSGCTWERTQ